jgi:hypothetical protein
MMCAMSDENELSTPPASVRDSAGVLANLPRSRPQRSSARRVAARDGGSARPARDTPDGPARQSPDRADGHKPERSGAKATKSARKPKAAAGTRATGATAASATAAGARSRASGKTGTRAREETARSRTGAAAKRAPRQGFESESESTTGPVVPPGATEFLTAATELVTEVAKSGLERGASTVRGILGRLHLS